MNTTVPKSSGSCSCKSPCTKQHQHQTLTVEVANQIFRQLGRCAVLSKGDEPSVLYDTILWFMRDLNPRGALETMMVSQAISSHFIAMHQLYLSSHEENLEAVNSRINIATKLQRSLSSQLSQLMSMRGLKSQQQVVRIERVDISGGQSIIGSQVEAGKGGYG